MAKKCKLVKIGVAPKFKSRQKNRCPLCGRSKAFLRKFNMCRICFRGLALKGMLPGVTKSSW